MKKETTEQAIARLRKQNGHGKNLAAPTFYKKRKVIVDRGAREAESCARAFETSVPR